MEWIILAIVLYSVCLTIEFRQLEYDNKQLEKENQKLKKQTP
jgi:hypothetical protein